MNIKSKEDLLAHYLKTDPQRFISLLVHDVRAPLTSIISASKLIEALMDEDEQIDKAQIQEILVLILKSTDDMRALLDIALQYERINKVDSPSQ